MLRPSVLATLSFFLLATTAFAQQVDPDQVSTFRPANPAPMTGPQAGVGTDLCVDHSGSSTWTVADLHGIDNSFSVSVDSITIDLGLVAGAFWDFDGSTSFADALDIVVGATNYAGTITTNSTSSGGQPIALTMNFSPALATGEFVRFGADTDFFSGDDGASFANAPALTTVNFSDGTSCLVGYSLVGSSASIGCCRPGGIVLATNGACPGPMTFTITGGLGSYAVLSGLPGAFTALSGPCIGTTVDIASPTFHGIFGGFISTTLPSGACGLTVQVVDIVTCQVSNTVVL